MPKISKTDEEWRDALTPDQYRILREHGTERPGSSPLNGECREGEYLCAGCGQKLFESDAKFDAHCGWPSFDRATEGAVDTLTDRSHGMVRTEVLCARCGGHLGHVFPDGPTQTGLRYCMNGAALSFEPGKK
ncbi:MAG TPA: peptide-methionine (R)-S-oxide reductase MsrB [Rhizomicrobium sp.]|jgi:peptide-methionine (R)-S-oxide reductase|nr:peptide-methionine (R)-S-oxide reductase MsrB [Rhizomicrobium sp.]